MLIRHNIRNIVGGFKLLRRFCTTNSNYAATSFDDGSNDDELQDNENGEKCDEYEEQTFPNVLEDADAISPMRPSMSMPRMSPDLEDEVGQQYTNILNAAGFSSFVFSKQRPSNETILVVHPKIRWGPASTPKNTTPELQVEEAVTLCRTIPGFNVVGAIIVGTDYNTKKKLIWGEGRLYKLLNYKTKHNISALMINVAMLTPLQQTELSAFFHVPVYDRFNVVMFIFKLYAKTREAHLQIALAEIPYIKHRMQYLMRSESSASALHISDSQISGQDGLDILRLHEHSLRKKISAAVDAKSAECEARRVERNGRPQRNCVVAVIGYTNAGKTSLIKKLTDSHSLRGENRLFATLDTSIHSAISPSRLKLIFADTIGFISDLPIQLFASFSATLRHVVNADLLVHVQDLSHPNVLAQHDNIMETLRGLRIAQHLIDTMIRVGNKLDRTTPQQLARLSDTPQFADGHDKNRNTLMVSCKSGEGLAELIRRIDLSAQRINGYRPRRLRLPPTSKTVTYLYENGYVFEEPGVSDCGKYLIFDVLMNDSQMAMFQANAGGKLRAAQRPAIQSVG